MDAGETKRGVVSGPHLFYFGKKGGACALLCSALLCSALPYQRFGSLGSNSSHDMNIPKGDEWKKRAGYMVVR